VPEPAPRGVTRETTALARASFERCSAAEDFLQAFYRTFFALCPPAKPLFAKTDFDKQIRLLKHAIGLLLSFPGQPRTEPGVLSRVAERHSRRDLNIAPKFYPFFVDALVQTARHFDAQWTPAVEDAWRATLAEGVAYMQSRY
jgi:hemoglobin-like flavoprotein